MFSLSGWAEDDNATAGVSISIDGGSANYPYQNSPGFITEISGGYRPDVCVVYPKSPACPNVGWSASLDTLALSNGTHVLTISASASYPNPAYIPNQYTPGVNSYITDLASTTPFVFIVHNPLTSKSTRVQLDQPAASQILWNTPVISGWAIDDNASIQRVDIYVDGKFVGSVTNSYSYDTYTTRPDVCAVYPNRPGCPNVGWSFPLDTSKLSNGVHTLTAVAISKLDSQASTSTTFKLENDNGESSTRVQIDSPKAKGANLAGTITISGWALNNGSANGTITISIDGSPFSETSTNVARQDVCQIYPDAPGCPTPGWSMPIDTTLLTNGEHTLQVAAAFGEDSAAASTMFTVSNSADSSPIKMNIDEPETSKQVAGITSFTGWALDQNTGVTEVTITVDGAPYGNAVYGTSRADVCAAFPSMFGCPSANVGWVFTVDTSTLTNGLHTVAATATSADGLHRTIKKQFTVAN